MSDVKVRRNTKNFWIEVVPPRGANGAIVHGTVIREDSQTQIFDETIDFISANSKNFGMNWLIDLVFGLFASPSFITSICSSPRATPADRQALALAGASWRNSHRARRFAQAGVPAPAVRIVVSWRTRSVVEIACGADASASSNCELA